MKVTKLFTLLALAAGLTTANAASEIKSKHISSQAISAFPGIVNTPIEIKNVGDKFSVSGDVFLASCGVVKLSMENVSQEEALSSARALSSTTELKGEQAITQVLIADGTPEGTCQIVQRETYTFFVNGCAAPLQGKLEFTVQQGRCFDLQKNF